jgi:hypothetical protein
MPDREVADAMIQLYHCMSARSFRGLWALEELGLPYELVMLPFPPRQHARHYLALNPLGTIPLLVHGDTRMTESAAICQYLCSLKRPTSMQVEPDEADYGSYLNMLHFGEATLTSPKRWCCATRVSNRRSDVSLSWQRTMPSGFWRVCGRWKRGWRKSTTCALAASLQQTFPLATHSCSRAISVSPRALPLRCWRTGSGSKKGQPSSGRSMRRRMRRSRKGSRSCLRR